MNISNEQILNYKNQINLLNNKNNELNSQILHCQNEIKELNNKNNQLKGEILNYQKEIKVLNNNNMLNNQSLYYENKIKELNDIIVIKNNEINELKSRTNSSNIIKEILPGEEIIAVLFISGDHIINYPIACKNTTIFVKIEEKLYEEYPEYKETDNYFLVSGIKVKRFKTIQENKITNGKPVMIIKGE